MWGSAEVYRLATSLLDPELAPARDLAALSCDRGESEGVVADVTSAHRGPRVVLLSHRPEGAGQELWAHLIVHHLTRDPMHHAATGSGPPLDPGRICVRAAQRPVRRDVSPLVSPL